jgi:hypothetical protein
MSLGGGRGVGGEADMSDYLGRLVWGRDGRQTEGKALVGAELKRLGTGKNRFSVRWAFQID